MADINAYLREAINGPAPQHKVAGRNQFEISEGSDGATHTKIVDVDGNPLSSMPVEDEAVKAELEEIKATQAEILDRLDGTFDTRLTGSNVEQEVNLKSSDLGKDNAIYTSTVEEYKLETLLDGQVLQPSEQKAVQINATNEKGIYLFISVDKPNWTLRGRTLFGRLNHETTYPSYNNHDKSYSSSEPALAFLLGIRPEAQGLRNPTNLDEARALRMPIGSDEYVMLLNNNEDPSTFTVKVLRIW